jgi:hypothetical protein
MVGRVLPSATSSSDLSFQTKSLGRSFIVRGRTVLLLLLGWFVTRPPCGQEGQRVIPTLEEVMKSAGP